MLFLVRDPSHGVCHARMSSLDNHTERVRARSQDHTEENESMKTNHKLALAVLAGVSIGIAGATAIHAQQVKTPPAYVIAEIAVIDPPGANLQKYAEKMPDTLAPFNHHYVVRGGKTQALEGEPPKTIVVIAFDSAAKAREWYDSPAYEAIKPIRQSATKSRLFIAEGVAP
jgi:uncharacterized protein (DUF1330 family)